MVKMLMIKQTNRHLLFISFTLLLLPLACFSRSHVRRVLLSHEADSYAVIFDAGSTGSRVHVFRFNQNLDLLPIGDDIEFYLKTTPGLSSYADDPEAAAKSLEPLLLEAEGVVPTELQPDTPLELGATAGLRMLNGNAADEILQAVRDMLKNESNFKYKAEWVSILNGTQEGSYFWVALNYLLGNLGKDYQKTIATIDLGGGSVQMSYAISRDTFVDAPIPDNGEEPYVQEKYLLGANYYLYVHSYLNYGLLAGRVEVLKRSTNSTNACILEGYDGYYTYNGVSYKAKAPPSGTSLKNCRKLARKVVDFRAPCKYQNCTFNGVWSGGGGAGMKNVYISSYFYDIASQVGIVDPSTTPSKIVKPSAYLEAAKVVCATNYNDMKSTFPNAIEDFYPYYCLDLVYQYTLLVDGFGVHPRKEITVITEVEYKNYMVGAAWPLGCAIDVISSSANKLLSKY
ncbi:apyrase-like [Ipomoea triloba]|uniref:apyrase-like n=1 Tax=Ipomoea triloba TaxID=35885 RepID=UPI00125E860A|nr:apyrase-like [Ipomoea triloba]